MLHTQGSAQGACRRGLPDMDRTLLKQHLARAERHLAEGQAHIEKQRAIIATLEQRGQDAGMARELLANLLRTQELHEQNREQILRELGEASSELRDAG